MDVFVTGGTGVLGRPTIRLLVREGHRVRGLAHSDGAAATLREIGAEPVRAGLFDVAALREALRDTDAVLHLATRIPPLRQGGKIEAWRENDRIRREGTRALVEAAEAVGVRTVIYPSFAFVYPDCGSAWIDAPAVKPRPASNVLLSTLDAEAEVARFSEHGGRGIVLRMGALYGPDAGSTNEMLALAGRGIMPILGPADAYYPSIWVDDAAAALAAALQPHVPAGIYDVVDDEPLTRRDLAPVIARAAGRKRLWSLPTFVARLAAPAIAGLTGLSLRISNRRFKEVSGWSPTVRDAQEGWARIANEQAKRWQPPDLRHQPAHLPWVRAGLLMLLLLTLPVGLWQQFAPDSFYAGFPGFGLAWVSVDGPYNEHLVRDVGAGNLSLATIILLALRRPAPLLTQAVAVAALVGGLPHLAYHVMHAGLLPTPLEQVLSLAALMVGPAVALALLFLTTRQSSSATRAHPVPAPAMVASSA